MYYTRGLGMDSPPRLDPVLSMCALDIMVNERPLPESFVYLVARKVNNAFYSYEEWVELVRGWNQASPGFTETTKQIKMNPELYFEAHNQSYEWDKQKPAQIRECIWNHYYRMGFHVCYTQERARLLKRKLRGNLCILQCVFKDHITAGYMKGIKCHVVGKIKIVKEL